MAEKIQHIHFVMFSFKLGYGITYTKTSGEGPRGYGVI